MTFNPETFRELAGKTTKGPIVASDQNSIGTWRIESDAPGYPNDGWVVCSELLGPDAEANAAFIAYCFTHAQEIAGLVKENARLREALSKVMPIRVHNGPDYAEVYFADGVTHSTQAMTMNPQDWLDIAAALERKPHD